MSAAMGGAKALVERLHLLEYLIECCSRNACHI